VFVTFEEGLLPTRREDPVDAFGGERQPQREQETRHQRPAQANRHLAEIDFGFHPGPVGLRHEHLDRAMPGLGPDLRLADRDIGANHLIRHINHGVLGDQPIEDPSHRMPLFPRCIKVSTQDSVDHRLERIQPRRPRRRLLPRRWPCRRQRLDYRAATDVVLALQSARRHPRTGIPADRRVKLYLRRWRHRRSLIWSTTHPPTARNPLRSHATNTPTVTSDGAVNTD
jgi:hypothetical protein